MGKTTKLTKDIILKRFNEIHNNFYDYSLFNEYINNRQKIKIICPIHGEFKQPVKSHLKYGCIKCGINKRSNSKIKKNKNKKESIINKFNTIHHNFYNYSISDFNNLKNTKYKINIICPNHGKFNQKIYYHLKGKGCPICKNNRLSSFFRSSTDDVVKKFNIIHNNKYKYPYIEHDYKNNLCKIRIVCPEHGEFLQQSKSHLNGNGCPKCYNQKLSDRLTKDNKYFINKSNIVHNNYYDYSLVNYINSRKKVSIICPKHGKFEQQPYVHLRGHGCSICQYSKGELIIKNLLLKNNIEFEPQKLFKDCRNILPLKFDFYLPIYNICIEFDGVQHFEPIDYFGGLRVLEDTQKRDKIKNEYCLNNNIRLIRIKYNENIKEKLKSILPL